MHTTRWPGERKRKIEDTGDQQINKLNLHDGPTFSGQISETIAYQMKSNEGKSFQNIEGLKIEEEGGGDKLIK